ncbi:MAG: rRNA maturation RNase YbeY [Gammaproteobacteria bacterium]|nr:rRNA maturation RNase YbeY [Gammaproteobacteria bacterium]
MSVQVTVQRAFRGKTPSDLLLTRWATRAVGDFRKRAALTLRIVGITEGANLNTTWRHKMGATNVLSFPAVGLESLMPEFLGDMVICAPLVGREAKAQAKALDAHWAHLTIHGVLHLLGFDHVTPAPTKTMETLERRLLAGLGYPDPYHQ